MAFEMFHVEQFGVFHDRFWVSFGKFGRKYMLAERFFNAF
jgi:hypothetical protein